MSEPPAPCRPQSHTAIRLCELPSGQEQRPEAVGFTTRHHTSIAELHGCASRYRPVTSMSIGTPVPVICFCGTHSHKAFSHLQGFRPSLASQCTTGHMCMLLLSELDSTLAGASRW